MTQSSDNPSEAKTDSHAQAGDVGPLVVVIICLTVVVVGWSVNYLLVGNDKFLHFFIVTFLPIFDFLLRLPEHLIV